MTDEDVEQIIAKNTNWPKFPVDYLREHNKWPPLPTTVVEMTIIPDDCKTLRYNAWCKAFGVKWCPNYIQGIITDPVSFDMVMIVVFDAFVARVVLSTLKGNDDE